MESRDWYLLLVFLFVGCSCRAQKAEFDEKLYGTWNSVGYGQQLKISKRRIALYDTYEGGCNINAKLPLDHIAEFYEIAKLTEDSLQLRGGFTKYDFARSQDTEFCAKSKNNPLANFDALWQTFKEHYAFFDLRKIGWNEMRNKYRKRISKKSTDLELYTVLDEMITELKDGHSFIEIPESLDSRINDDDDNDDLRRKVINVINQKYVVGLKTYNKGIVNWGFVNDSLGYLQFNDFEDLANYDIPSDLSAEEFTERYWDEADESENYTKDVLGSFKKQMEIIHADIKNTKYCIIDVRFNGGGFDQVGLNILSYFTDDKVVAFVKKVRLENGFSEPQTIYIRPNEKNYGGNLYILTSPQTASASETFVLASQNIKNTTRIGSRTEGILSDILSKRLPNGWEYGLSNEIYENVDGVSYEKNGIPPDYELNYSRAAGEFYRNLLLELKNSDRAIEMAIDLSE